MYPFYRIIVAIIRKGDQLLIVNNQSGQEKRWSLPGGQIESGETLGASIVSRGGRRNRFDGHIVVVCFLNGELHADLSSAQPRDLF